MPDPAALAHRRRRACRRARDGNDWAKGFLCGARLLATSWRELLDSDEKGGAIVPMIALAHDNDPDPELNPGAFSPHRREKAIVAIPAGLTHIYRHFAPHRRALVAQVATVRRPEPKVGRNEPSACGSGKKFKHCHGSALGRSNVLH